MNILKLFRSVNPFVIEIAKLSFKVGQIKVMDFVINYVTAITFNDSQLSDPYLYPGDISFRFASKF